MGGVAWPAGLELRKGVLTPLFSAAAALRSAAC